MAEVKNIFGHGGALIGEPAIREYIEVEIPVPWGHVSGKWYGPQNKKALLAMHGWFDNAGTYDFLAALLPTNLPFLALDLPGHGLSSRLPDGTLYSYTYDAITILSVMDYYKWEKVPLLAHSMSATLCYIFASIFPDKAELVIALDTLKPPQRPLGSIINIMGLKITEFLREDQRNRNGLEPPSYTYEELVERVSLGSYQSVREDRAVHLLARNVARSKHDPNRYYFSRDRRRRIHYYNVGPQQLCNEMSTRIKCPYMFIKARQSPNIEDKADYMESLQLMQQKTNFIYFECDGTHHVHFNNPERILHPILNFLKRYANHLFQCGDVHSKL